MIKKLNNLFHRSAHSWFLRMGSVSLIVVAATLLVVFTARAVTILSVSGYADHSYGSAVLAEPTDGRAESKLWWNDGLWWGNLYNPQAGEYQIYKLDWNTQTWVTTNITTDDRESSRADVLWDQANSKLYVASHFKLENPSQVTGRDNWGRLYRYSYNTTTNSYSLDAGFENNSVIVNQDKTRALVLDKDSTGRLWVTYVSRLNGSATEYKVYLNYTTTSGDDVTWAIPFTLDSLGLTGGVVDQGATSSVVAFQDNEGPKIGVMWSNELDGKFYFASHLVSASPIDPTSWKMEPGLTAAIPYAANGHINIAKAPNGQLFIAIKTHATAVGEPLTALVARETDGTFSLHPVNPVESNDTRPIAVYYAGSNQPGDEFIYVFMVSDPSGGGVCYLRAQVVSPLKNISFDQRFCGNPGLAGAPQILADTTKYTNISDVTSTKQVLNETTDIVVLAADDVQDTYVHAVLNKPLPYVLSVLPKPNSSVPILGVLIRASFSKEMDATSFNSSTYYLKDSKDATVAGSITYYSTNRSAVFTPNALLKNGETYTVTLTAGVKDSLGQPLLNTPYTWKFTVTDTVRFYIPIVVR